ncbi:MAG: hypothetical protein AB7D36_10995 [Oscillospiraceae bacterium]
MEFKITMAIIVAGIVILAVWYINGALVTPVVGGKNIGIQVCVKASGSAPELEHTVSGLLWLVENGTINGEIVIVDDEMDDYTRLTAEMLAKDDDRIHLGVLGDLWSRNEI